MAVLNGYLLDCDIIISSYKNNSNKILIYANKF